MEQGRVVLPREVVAIKSQFEGKGIVGGVPLLKGNCDGCMKNRILNCTWFLL